jgi:membrane protease YdiL (CAAX protease family)
MAEKVLVLDELPPHLGVGGKFSLTRMIFSIVGIFCGYRAFSWVAGIYLLRSFDSGPNSASTVITGLAYPATTLFILFELLVVIWIYRPVRSLFNVFQGKTGENLFVADMLIGTGAGLLVFVAAIPFLKDLNTRTFFVTVFPSIHPLTLRTLAYAALFGLVLPVAGEIVFRGILLRTLQGYARFSAAILVSTLVFVAIWPLFGVAVSLLLGTTASLLYRWRKSLISSIFADIAVTVCGGLYVLWRIWS